MKFVTLNAGAIWNSLRNACGLKSLHIMILIIITFPSDLKTGIVTKYCKYMQNKKDTHNYRVILVGDFNVPGFDWT
jgi:hypothetical protein